MKVKIPSPFSQMTPLDTVTAGRERPMATNGGATFSELDWLRSGRTAARRLRNWTDEVDERGRRRGNIAEGSDICSRCSRSYAVEEEHIPFISEGGFQSQCSSSIRRSSVSLFSGSEKTATEEKQRWRRTSGQPNSSPTGCLN